MDFSDSDTPLRSKLNSLLHERQALQEFQTTQLCKRFQEDLRQQRDITEQGIFSADRLDLTGIATILSLIGQRNGLISAESWFEGRIIELNQEIAALNKQV